METLQQAVIINADEKVLLLKCGKSFGKTLAGKWEFPNAFLEEDKTFDQNLKEGVKELIGVEVDIIYQFFTGMFKEEDAEFLNVGFLCRLKGTDKVKIHEDYDEFKWVGTKELTKLKLTNVQIKEMAEKALAVMEGAGTADSDE